MTNTDTETDSWPIPDRDTVVVRREADTIVGAPPPPPVAPTPPPPAPDRRIGAGMLLAIAAILLVLAGIAVAYFLTHRSSHGSVTTVVLRTGGAQPKAAVTPKVAVPRVVGLKEQAALLRLAQLGLRPKEVYRPTKQPSGVVVSQKPQDAKNVRKGTQVTIVIDSGAAQVAVPDLSGKSFADAQAALDKLGLDSTQTQVTSDQPAGSVVDQAPKAGSKLAKGSTVTLSVAKGSASQTTSTGASTGTTSTTSPATTAAAPAEPQSATMPDVTTQQEQAAVQSLNAAGILASLFFIPGTDPLGTVEQQAKQAGTTVPYHAHVQINVSSGPGDKPKEQVPNVVGRTLDEAVSALQGAHLRLIFVKYPVTSRSQAGKVVQQSPLGGGQAPQNAQVLVFLGAYKG